MTVTSELRYTHKQKEQRNKKEKRRLHPVETQRKTQNPRMVLQVLKHRGAPLEADESGFGSTTWLLRVEACTPDQEKPACAMG